MISISSFYFCEKVFTHTNIWMIGKNLVRLYSHLNGVPKNVLGKIVPTKNVLPGKMPPEKLFY